ncbi:MAG: hypothetical protein ACLUEK_14710 [Oscillospiraceae bacterium]
MEGGYAHLQRRQRVHHPRHPQLAGLREDGKSYLYDGRTGERFDNAVTVGYVYFLKLHHLVDDKIHARSTGPYSLVTQQPLGGKAQFGGQRFGEMEVWALEAYGAAYTCRRYSPSSPTTSPAVSRPTRASSRATTSAAGRAESFKVLVKELQSLCLDVRILDKNGDEIELKDDDDDDYIPGMKDEDRADDSEIEDAGFSIENVPEDDLELGSLDDDDDGDDDSFPGFSGDELGMEEE